MPLGKNSIKRAANNGYSNVKTAAPDMENSEVVEVKSAPKKATKKAPVKTVAPEVTPAAKPAEKKPAVKKSVKKPASVDGFKRVSFGEDMPYYLL